MNNLVFTRLLYPKHLVIQTLISNIFAKNTDAAMHWCFELYNSEIEVYNILRNIANVYYSNCIGILPFIDKVFNNMDEPIQWGPAKIIEKKKREILAISTIIHNLCIRETKNKNSKLDKSPIRLLTKTQENQYCVFFTPRHKWYQYREHVIAIGKKYPIKNSCINQAINDNLLDAWRKYPEYYASKCPYWEKKIIEFDGVINHETKKIDFADDDMLEGFYEQFAYDSDEQPWEVIESVLGIRKSS